MLFFFCLFASALAYTDLEYENSFATFIKEHDKHYANEEIIHRFNVFRKTMDIIAEHNSGNHSWTMGITQFADLTNKEFRTMMLGYMPKQDRNNNSEPSRHIATAPTNDIDWTKKGAVTPVKNQGQCGSCWAFSTTGSVEGAYEIAHGSLKSFSEQALVDCSKDNNGCKGGLMDYAFKYIESSGLPLESAYPYTARDGTCRAYTSVVKVTSYRDVPAKSVSALGTALEGQPIAVAVDATKWSHYTTGVYSCSGTIQLDHGVLLVGSTADTWLVKNSWGTTWGENGYIELSKNIGEDCGITQAASYPSV